MIAVRIGAALLLVIGTVLLLFVIVGIPALGVGPAPGAKETVALIGVICLFGGMVILGYTLRRPKNQDRIRD